jgi:hypothetical protein
MADLTLDANLRFKGQAYTETFTLDTSAAQVVYRGAPIMIVALGDTMHAIFYQDSVNVAAADVCLGIAAEHKVVATTDDEDYANIAVYVWPTIIGIKNITVPLTNADIGKEIYMSDSATLSETVGDNVWLGKLFKVEDDYCYVQLRCPVICSGAGG